MCASEHRVREASHAWWRMPSHYIWLHSAAKRTCIVRDVVRDSHTQFVTHLSHATASRRELHRTQPRAIVSGLVYEKKLELLTWFTMSHRTMTFVWDVTHACRMPWCWNWQHSTAEPIYIRVSEPWQGGYLVKQRTNFVICAALKVNTNYVGVSGLSNASRISSSKGDNQRENPQILSFSAFFQIKIWMFSKKIKNNALDIIRVIFKDESIAIDIYPQLNFFLDFSRAVTSFCKNKVRKN